MASSSISHRLCFAVLFCAAVGAFASSLETPLAWLFTLPACISIFKTWERIPKALVTAARRVLWIVCGVTLVLGWILMAYPILSANVVTFLSLAIGYTLAFLGTLFLLGETAWPAPTTFLPASIGLFVVAGFNPLASLDLFLWVAGVAVFCYLGLGSTGFRGNRALGLKLVSLALTGLAVGSMAWAIIRLLPWAQGKVEETAVQFYVPSNTGFTGSSSYARLGELERLKRSKRLVMRVWTSGPQKLRGQVLTRFDGQGWKIGPGVRTTLLPENAALALDDSLNQWLGELPGNDFRLGWPPGPGSLSKTKVLRADDGSGVLFVPTGTFLVRAPIDELHQNPEGALSQPLLFSTRIYGVLSSRAAAVEEPSPEVRAACLEVPEETDPRLKELAARLSEGATSTEERIRRTVEHVGNTCHYSLDVGKFESDQPVAEFLFEKKRGYCQYFASAAALLLRLQGVPTRYVGGFNLAGASRRAGHYVVRESDAHAWIEAFVPGKGWIEADATPAAEYDSLHADLESGWLNDAVEWAKAAIAEASVRIRQGDWRSLAYIFKRWIYVLIERPLWGLSFIVLLVGAALLFIKGRWKRDRVHRTPVDEAREVPKQLLAWMARLEKQWKKHGSARPPNRAPLEHALGLPREKTPTELCEASVRVVECYYRARFRGDRVSPDELDALRRVMEG